MDNLNIYGSPNVPVVIDPRAMLLANRLRQHLVRPCGIAEVPEVQEVRRLRAMNLVYMDVVERQNTQIKDVQRILDKIRPDANICDRCSELYINNFATRLSNSDVCAGCYVKLHYCSDCSTFVLLYCNSCHIHICPKCHPDNAPCRIYCAERKIRGYSKN
jgi:hypothetical protein